MKSRKPLRTCLVGFLLCLLTVDARAFAAASGYPPHKKVVPFPFLVGAIHHSALMTVTAAPAVRQFFLRVMYGLHISPQQPILIGCNVSPGLCSCLQVGKSQITSCPEVTVNSFGELTGCSRGVFSLLPAGRLLRYIPCPHTEHCTPYNSAKFHFLLPSTICQKIQS